MQIFLGIHEQSGSADLVLRKALIASSTAYRDALMLSELFKNKRSNSGFRLPAASGFFPEAKNGLRKQEVWRQLLRQPVRSRRFRRCLIFCKFETKLESRVWFLMKAHSFYIMEPTKFFKIHRDNAGL